jgi:hypothetical protein
MKQIPLLSEDILVQRCIEVLLEKLGPIETRRFLSLPVKQRIDSVKRHQIWQSKMDKKTFFDDVFGVQ